MATASAMHTASDDNDFRYYKSYLDECNLTQQVSLHGTLSGLNMYIRNNIENWKNSGLAIAVTGTSGSGKSSLINALRNLKANNKGAAQVGVTETTTIPMKYEFPDNPRVALWDLPGCGTRTLQRDDYVKYMKLSGYDVFIVVSATRFTENDLMLARAVEQMGKNILFVRTKIDFDLMNAKRDNPDAFNEEVCMDEMKGEINTNLAKTCLSSTNRGIYLVSSPDRSRYDLLKLLLALKMLLNKKSKAVPRLLQIKMKDMMEEKCKKVENSFVAAKVNSAIAGFLPIPNLENRLHRDLLANIQQKCLTIFFLDDQSLNAVSSEIGKTVQYLKDQQDKLIGTDQLYTRVVEDTWSHFSQYVKYYVPIFGSVVSAQNSVYTMHYCVHEICSDMATKEMKLINLRLNKLEGELMPFSAQT